MSRHLGMQKEGMQQEPEMRCVLCHAEIPVLNGESETEAGRRKSPAWFVSVDGIRFAACAGHFPPDSAGEAAYTAAWKHFVSAAVQAMEDVIPGASLFSLAPDLGPGHGDS